MRDARVPAIPLAFFAALHAADAKHFLNVRELGSRGLRRIAPLLLAASLVALAAPAQQYNFMHFAGSVGGPGAYDSSGAQARFSYPLGIAFDNATGILYVSDDSDTIRAMKPGNLVTTVAGLIDGPWALDGARAAAGFHDPQHLTLDGAGNIYVADRQYSLIRKITPKGVVTTLAGSMGLGTADGTGSAAGFGGPQGIAWDATTGVLYVADTGNHTIRKVTLAGVVTTLAGTAGVFGSTDAVGPAASFRNPAGVAVDASGNVWVADTGNHTIRKITPGGSVTTVAGTPLSADYVNSTGSLARFNTPSGIAIHAGVAYVADTNNNAIRKVTSAGLASTLAGVNPGSADGTGFAAQFLRPFGVSVSSAGDVYVTDSYNHTIRKVTSAGVVTTIAGDAAESGAVDATGASARFYAPIGGAADAAGNLFVADKGNRVIRKITPAGVVTTFAGTFGGGGTGDGTGPGAQFIDPHAMAIDGSGNLYVTDPTTNTIRKITPAAVVTTFAGTPGPGGSTDATGAAASFKSPEGIAADASGNVYVADTWNHTIRKITPAGVVTTLAGTAGSFGSDNGTGSVARFKYPRGLACDGSGNVYVADSVNHTIRKITPAGVVTTVAGLAGSSGGDDGTGSAARFSSPMVIASDSSGTLYVGEGQSPRIRKITPAGVVTTLAGHIQDRGMEPGTGPVARFVSPGGLVLSGSAIFYIDDRVHAIKRGLPAFGTVATIDDASAPVGETRQLDASPDPGSTRTWSMVRRPALSSATIPFPAAASPTFTPDVPDTYIFRLVAHGATSSSITTVTLTAECWSIGIAPSSLPNGLKNTAYSQWIIASGGSGAVVQRIASGTLPAGMTFSSGGLLSGTPTEPGLFYFTVRAEDTWGCVGEREYILNVRALPPPTGLVATAAAGPSVSLTWNAVSGATSYDIYRRSASSGLGYHASSSSPSYTDSFVASDKAYLYVVRARDAAAYESSDSAADIATTVSFTDPTIVAGSTLVKAVHVLELRTAVNAVQTLAGLAPTSFTDATLAGVLVKAVHMTQLRSGLNTARTTLGVGTVTFTDSSPEGSPVKAVHFQELRTGVQ